MAAYRRGRGPLLFAIAALILVACSGSGAKSSAEKGTARTRSSVVTQPKERASSTTTTNAPPREVQIVASGFTQLPVNLINDQNATYAAVVRNLSDSKMADSVSLNISFTDANGTVVKAQEETISLILPGQSAAVGGSQISAPGAVNMKVQALVTRWIQPSGAVGAFTAEGITNVPQQYGGMKTNATIKSTFAKDLKSPQAIAVYYNAAGMIIGGGEGFIDFVPSSGSSAVEISGPDGLAGIARTDVFVSLSSLSLLGS